MKKTAPRRAVLKAFAKINLSLQVGRRRADGYHDLRTVFQTVSLADQLEIEFTPGRPTRIHLSGVPSITDNIVERAARDVMRSAGIRGSLRMHLEKRIPMGGGLGGGSSDAAAVLLALPVLAGAGIPMDQLRQLAAALGSDVPFFLEGGTCLGEGRGELLTRVKDASARHALLVIPEVAVSTAAAYRDLELTGGNPSNRMKRFQSLARALADSARPEQWKAFCENDFESVVFRRYPLLHSLHRKLRSLGAGPARMSGSGSTLFGVFAAGSLRDQARQVLDSAGGVARVEPFHFVSRKRYRAALWNALGSHMDGKKWPPLSRYAE
ncbi:MAG: 4-(cytidine 5'-diphospho)-2-C-methyl-D-erythritol kinase [Acidimicrobiia bacterium]|nr:4-(cytidine 5'-diphospho)-2-C-methyl-D-erythritol kinase [Acidimicrobiia bacterium]